MSIKERVLKYFAGFTYLVAGVVLTFGILVGIFIYMSPPCLEDEALVKARSVSDAEWAQIYDEAIELLKDESRHRYNLDSLPESIAKLEPVSVTSHGSSLWLYLATCGLDSKVIVFIRDSETFGQEIVLGWGDPQQSAKLWVMPNKGENADKIKAGSASLHQL